MYYDIGGQLELKVWMNQLLISNEAPDDVDQFIDRTGTCGFK